MPKKAPADHPNLFAVAPVEKPSLLSGVPGDRTPEPAKVENIEKKRATKQRQFGRPDARILDEAQWPSRELTRKGLRLNPRLVVETESQLKRLGGVPTGHDMSALMDWAMNLWLEMGAPSLGVRATALLLCSSCGFNLLDQTTTTTTEAVAQTLPGFPTELLGMPHNSRHTLQTLWEYALSSYQAEFSGFEGVQKPHFWIKKAWREGTYDSQVDGWKEARRVRDERLAGQLRRREEEQERMRNELGQLQRERAERAAKEEK